MTTAFDNASQNPVPINSTGNALWVYMTGSSASGSTNVLNAPVAGTDRSITASTSSQQLMPANATRHGFLIKNDSTIDIWINIGSTAVAAAGGGNLKISANGGYYEAPVGFTTAINIIAASGSPAITAREY